MGNCCSQFRDKFQPRISSMHIEEFRLTYKVLESPKSLAFKQDSKLSLIQDRSDKEYYILKKIEFQNEKDMSTFVANIHKAVLEHDNILKINSYAVERNQPKNAPATWTVNLVLESFVKTLQEELASRVKKNTVFEEKEILDFMWRVTDALELLQLKNMSLGVLRPCNIYLTSKNEPKFIIIPGAPESTVNQETQLNQSYLDSTAAGTPNNNSHLASQEQSSTPLIASQVKTSKPQSNNYKSDVYSFGVMMMKLITLQENSDDLQVIKQKYEALKSKNVYGSLIHSLIDSMVTENEANRPDFVQLHKMMMIGEYIRESSPVTTAKPTQIVKEPEFKERTKETEITIKYEVTLSKGPQEKTKARTNYSAVKLEEEEDRLSSENDEALVENENDLINLFQQKISNLKNLVINLEKRLSGENITMISQVIARQTGLNELVLSLPKARLGDEGLETICKGISETRQVSICYLDFRKSRITDAGLKNLGACLLNKPKLFDLGLNLCDNSITQEGCKEIAIWLSKLKDLKSLALNLGGNKVGTQGATTLGNEFNNLKELESLMVFLYSNEIEGKEGLVAILEGVKQMKNLKKIILNFVSNTLKEEGLTDVLAFLKASNLEEIAIHLGDNSMSEKAMAKAINECPSEKNIQLRF